MIGTHLGPYEITQEIGVGGMASVFRARQASMERDVAIKIIHRGLSDTAAVQRFQREARLIARLEHPHILPVYDFDGAHDPPYIVMRFLDGGTLEDILARGLLPAPAAAGLMRQVCAGLDYAHRQGVIHRDIKPSNILFDREGNAFVTDFGIARSAAGEASMRLTQEGMVLGSVEYMSPEQVMGRRDLDHRSDLYSLGIMLFRILTGRLPYVSDPPLGVLAMHLQAPIPSACAINPELPAAIDAVFQRALAKAPEQRFHNAVELSVALDEALGGAITGSALPRDTGYLREIVAFPMAGLGLVGKTPPGSRMYAAPGERNSQILAMYASAAEYAEMVETARDRETAHHVMLALYDVFDRIVTESGGVVLLRTDNDLLAVWGAAPAESEPPAAGDPSSDRVEADAERAIRVALAFQDALREQDLLREISTGQTGARPFEALLPLNIGIHSGMALVSPVTQPDARTGMFTVTGSTVSMANRLMQAAYGTILISHDVYRMVRGVFEVQPDLPLRVRGRVEGVPVYRVSAAKPRAFRMASRGVEGIETRMIGRETELRRLQHAFLNAIEDAETQVVTISGEAGVGKSRLLDAFDQWCELRPEMFFIFRGRSVGAPNRPYALLRDLVSFRFQIRGDDSAAQVVEKLENGVAGLMSATHVTGEPALIAHRIGHLCGYDVAASPHIKPLLGDPALLASESRQAFIQFMTALACADNVLIEIEDLHQADDASLDLLTELFRSSAASSEDTHLMVACTARPAIFSRHPDWGRGQPFHTRVDLQPLDRRESRELLGEILQKVPEVPRQLRDLLVDRSEGNPYFLEELIKLLIDDRVIIPESDTLWRVEESRLGGLKVPPSLAALIEARLDTLLTPERLVLLRASVFGRVFYREVLEKMDEADTVAHGTAAHVANLPEVLEGLAHRDFIIQHETSAFTGVEEFAFAQSLLRDVVYDLVSDRQRRIYHRATAEWLSSLKRVNEYFLQIADHFEQAGAWAEAANAFGQAGERAYRRGLFREAEELYERGFADLPEDDPVRRLGLLLGLGAAAHGRGNLPEAEEALKEAFELATSQGDVNAQAECCSLMGSVQTARGNYPTALDQFNQAEALARRSGDRRVLLGVLAGLADMNFRTGNIEKGLRAAVEGRDLARLLGDDARLALILNRLGTILMLRGENDAAREQLEQGLALARRVGHRLAEAACTANIGMVNTDDHRRSIANLEMALPIFQEVGDLFGELVTRLSLAENYLYLGEVEKAPPLIREAMRAALEMRSEASLLRCVLVLGQLHLAQGDLTGGMALIGLARSHPAGSADHRGNTNDTLHTYQERLGLSDAAVVPMLEAGQSLDLNRVVKEFLEEK